MNFDARLEVRKMIEVEVMHTKLILDGMMMITRRNTFYQRMGGTVRTFLISEI